MIGGAALIGAAAGLVISGPLVGLGLGAAAAATTLRKDKVGPRQGEGEGFLRGRPLVGALYVDFVAYW